MSREMKDSGVEWIGEIPQDWNVCKIKRIAEGLTDGTHGTYERTSEGCLLLSAKNVFEDGLHIGENESLISKEDYKSIISNGFPRENDVLLCCVGTIGRCTVYKEKEPIAFQRSVIFIRCNNRMLPSFLNYNLQSPSTLIQEKLSVYKSAQEGIYQGAVKELQIVLPEIKQQKRIIDYLDAKCSKIDEIIERQKAIIEKLKEYKLSIITEAVTKGLNPDVEMKDSGNIEIGKIPSISRPTKLKYLCNTQGRIGFKGYTTTDLVDEGEGAYTLGASHLNNGKIDLTDPVFISWEKYYESPEIMVKQNDILIVQRGSTIGKVAIVDKNYGEVTINPSLVLINKIHIDSKYLLYALSARYIINYINLIGTTTAIPMISQKQINDLVVIVPPDSIQISVVKYLDEKCGKIDANILKKQKLIDKLQEYKKSLIYEVVTGKKEV